MKYPIQNPWGRLFLHLVDFVFSFTFISKTKPVAPPKKILISNIAHLGDVILATSILAPIKAAFPSCTIGFLCSSQASFLLKGHPLINHLHTFDHWKLNRGSCSRFQKVLTHLQTRNEATREMKKIGYDTAIDLPFHFPNAAYLFWRARISQRIGFSSAGFGPLMHRPFSWGYEDLSAAESFFSLACVFEEVKPFRHLLKPSLPIGEKNVQNYLVLHIGSGNSIKEWPIKKWRALALKLDLSGIPCLFTGKGEREHFLIEEVIAGLKNAQNLCNKLKWEEFVCCIQNAKGLISVDTSAAHIASATETPTLLLQTGIYPKKLWKPFSEKVHPLTYPVRCSPCLNGSGCSRMGCIRLIGVDEVFQKAQELFLRSSSGM